MLATTPSGMCVICSRMPPSSNTVSSRTARFGLFEEEVDARQQAVELVARLADRLADLLRQRDWPARRVRPPRRRGSAARWPASRPAAPRPRRAGRRARAAPWRRRWRRRRRAVSASSAPVAGLWICKVGMSVFHGAKAAPATHETGVAKRTPWSRLCRATGVAGSEDAAGARRRRIVRRDCSSSDSPPLRGSAAGAAGVVHSGFARGARGGEKVVEHGGVVAGCRAPRCRGTPGATARRPRSPARAGGSPRPCRRRGSAPRPRSPVPGALMPWWWMLLAMARVDAAGTAAPAACPARARSRGSGVRSLPASRCAQRLGPLRRDVLVQRAAEHHVEQLQAAADAEHRLAGLDEGAHQLHLVAVAHAVAGPVGVQRRFAVALGRHVVAALQHQAVERGGVVVQVEVSLRLTMLSASTAGTITAIAPPRSTQCATDCSR